MNKLPINLYIKRYHADQSHLRIQFLSLVCIFITLPGIAFFSAVILPKIVAAHQPQALPQLSINASAPPTVIAGQPVAYTLTVSTSETGGPLSNPLPGQAPLHILGAIGAGTKGLNVSSGASWNCTTHSGKNLASTISCDYRGTAPIAAGQDLPLITITAQTVAGTTPNPLNSQFLTYANWDTSGSHIARMATIVTGGQNADTFASLAVRQKHKGGDTFKIGQYTIYNFTVQNTSSIDFTGGTALFPISADHAPAIEMAIEMPPGADVSIHRAPPGWSCTFDQGGSVIRCLWKTYPIAPGVSLPNVEIVAAFTSGAASSVYAPAYVTTAVLSQDMPILGGVLATDQVQVLHQTVPFVTIPTQIVDITPTPGPITPLPLVVARATATPGPITPLPMVEAQITPTPGLITPLPTEPAAEPATPLPVEPTASNQVATAIPTIIHRRETTWPPVIVTPPVTPTLAMPSPTVPTATSTSTQTAITPTVELTFIPTPVVTLLPTATDSTPHPRQTPIPISTTVVPLSTPVTQPTVRATVPLLVPSPTVQLIHGVRIP